MTTSTDTSLLGRNTFGIDVRARQVVDYDSIADLQSFIAQRNAEGNPQPLLHIGGGSNLLFTADFEGTILHSCIKSIELLDDADGAELQTVRVRVGAGIVWDEWVDYAIAQGWYGLENLSLIPGEVGASAVQNIGAYGVEAKNVIDTVEVVSLMDGSVRSFQCQELGYGYRKSRFKTDLRGLYAVTHVTFRLSRNFSPRLEYGGLRSTLAARGIAEDSLTARQLRDVIISVRQAKLPDPAVLGNAGSFFVNPVVTRSDYERVVALYASQGGDGTVPHYDVDADHVKIPAGWLIEQCGWKGHSLGPAAVYERQALVLVNTGGATGQDILRLCKAVQDDVYTRYGIRIVPEVNVV